jgi:hypothetical protein
VHARLVAEQPPSVAAAEYRGDRGAAPGVVVSHAPDVPLQATGGDQAEQRVLGRARRVLAQRAGGRGQPPGQSRRCGQPADPHGRGEDLRRGAQVHHDLGIQPEQGG